jgi:hypothetical protein
MMNIQGICALSDSSSYLALPSKSNTGSIGVANAMEGSNVLAELDAHKSTVVSHMTKSLLPKVVEAVCPLRFTE